jgi:hypothetical protein
MVTYNGLRFVKYITEVVTAQMLKGVSIHTAYFVGIKT